jgi:filamentous hemagglutinin family protein
MQLRLLLTVPTIPILISSLSAHAEVTLDGTLGRGGALPGPEYLIGADLGQQHGGNLFHSFQDFNLNRSESATFSGPNSVSNIISRVTGGNPSNIDGLIRSTIPNADMYFLNPYGIMFGPNAQLDVQGSFHASTADYLRLGKGGRFDARNPNNSILTIAPVEAFGFLNSQVAPISIQGRGEVTQGWTIQPTTGAIQPTGLSVREGKTLSLIGGQIEMWMGTFFKMDELDFSFRLPVLSAPYGRINLVSVASQGEVKLGGDFVDMSSFSQLADIHIKENSLLQTNGEGGGSIFIRGDRFVVDDSQIEANTLGSQDGDGIDINVSDISLNKSWIFSNTFGEGNAGPISIGASDISLNEKSQIFSAATDKGNAGPISINASNISLNQSYIFGDTYGEGNAGQISIDASTLSLLDRSRISSITETLNESDNISRGDAGSISINASDISLLEDSSILTSTDNEGNAGQISIENTGTVTVEGDSQISGYSSGTGNAGRISIETSDLFIKGGSLVSSDVFDTGNGNDIYIRATGIVSVVGANGDGWASVIASSSNPETEGIKGGQGGNIRIESKELIVKDGGQITVSSIAQKGTQSRKSGDIKIHVQGAIELSGVNPYGENEDGFGSGIYTRSTGVGNNAGDAGDMTLQANSLIINDGAVIISSTNNNAQGGKIELDVRGQIHITGDASNIPLEEPASSQLEYLQGFSPSNYNQSTSGIYARSEGKNDQAGQGGNITLTAQNLILTNKGKISTASAGGGKAGNLIIEVTQLQLDDSASIASKSTLSNRHRFTTLAERDSRLLIAGDRVEVANVGDGKSGRYINIGNNLLIRTTPIDTVADMAALLQLSKKYSIAKGDVIEVQDIGNGQSAHFIYAEEVSIKPYLLESEKVKSEWVKIGDKETVTLLDMAELEENIGQFGIEIEKEVPYPSGTVIQVKDVGNGKPATFIYSSFFFSSVESPHFNYGFGQANRKNFFNVADTSALHELSETTSVQIGAIANVIDARSRFVFNGQSWVKWNNTQTVTNIADMNALAVAQIGNIAKIAQVESGQPSRFIYSGEQWLPMNTDAEPLIVSNLSELDQLSAKPGDLVGVTDAGRGQDENFFYADGKWNKQNRGGDAGRITITARDGIRLSGDSAITAESISGGGGILKINAEGLVFLEKGEITTSVKKGAGKGGDLTISNPQIVVLNNGKIIAQAEKGHGGDITINSDHFIQSKDNLITISASSRLGMDGKVKIDSPDMDMEKFLVVLPAGFVDASNLMTTPCSQHLAENLSSFVVRASEGTSNMPDDLLPSGPLLSESLPIKTATSIKNPPKNWLIQPVIANEKNERFTNNTFFNYHLCQNNNNRWHRQKNQSPNDLKPSRLSNANTRVLQSSVISEEPLF